MLPQQPTACRRMDSISRRFRPAPHLKAQLRLSAGNVLAFFLPVSRETFSAKNIFRRSKIAELQEVCPKYD